MGQNKKEKYSFFEALNILHQQDVESGAKTTGNVVQCLHMISVNKVNGGCSVAMGAPEQEMYGIMAGDKIPVLVTLNKKAYEDLQYPKPEPFEPRILIDEDLGAWDILSAPITKFTQMRKAKDILCSFISASKDRDKFTEINIILHSSERGIEHMVKALTVVRFADRALEIHITLMNKEEYKFEIEF